VETDSSNSIGGSGVAGSTVCVWASASYNAFGERGIYTANGSGNISADYNPVGFGGQYGYYKELEGHYLLGHRFYGSFTG